MLRDTVNGKLILVPDEDRTQVECWTRVMGYYRPISEFNIGKSQEHRDRKFMTESKANPV